LIFSVSGAGALSGVAIEEQRYGPRRPRVDDVDDDSMSTLKQTALVLSDIHRAIRNRVLSVLS